jgi:hypothetical protein
MVRGWALNRFKGKRVVEVLRLQELRTLTLLFPTVEGTGSQRW